ncbi:hypothetical protein KR044_008453 [Drosophila immigrans]|nr:hypothetical protein KR044_008453 [Drosophila immigrans]
MTSPSHDNVPCPPCTMLKTTAAKSVPGATNLGTSSGAPTKCGFYDDQEMQLLNVSAARHNNVNNGSASSAPGPGLLTNGTASDMDMRWWW